MPLRTAPLTLLMTVLVCTAAPLGATVDAARAGPAATSHYPAAFFAEYHPQTALDMVRQVPGFRIDNGGGGRGLGGARGNVLIDGRRPGTKQDSITAQLERIPADRVDALALVRPGTGGADVDARRLLVDVRLKPGSTRSWAWSATVEQDTDSGGPTPSGRIALIDRIGPTDLRAGLSVGTSFVGNRAVEVIDERDLDSGWGPFERRRDSERFRSRSIALNLNTETELGHRRLLRAHVELGASEHEDRRRSDRVFTEDPAVLREQLGDRQRDRYELGADLAWWPHRDWRARAIALTRRNANDDLDRLRIGASEPELQDARRADQSRIATETVLRTEWVHHGLPEHRLALDLETAWNALEGTLVLDEDAGNGVLVPVDVPGSNTQVEEWRLDGRIHDRFRVGELIFEPALGAEHSVIRQSGPGGREQDFTFVKPALTIVHAPEAGIRNRLRVERVVAQLDFGDFVSSADFADDELDLGNPGLGPQQTWVAELVHERRFGEIGVATLTAFHHWVDDVQDRLPIGDGQDVPGNIGDGRRWGLALQTTMPLDALGLVAARMDLTARWEDSTVVDPVTGIERPFSWQRRYRFGTRLRQDLVESGWAWGIETDYADAARSYGADEIDRYQDGIDVEAFIETTRIAGVKVRLLAQNLLDRPFERERLRFDGDRIPGIEPAFREARDLRRDRSILLSVSGTF